MMNHSDTQPLSAEELMSLVYGEETLPPERQRHLDECPHCLQELAALRQMHGRLSTRVYRSLCPDTVRLHYYCLDTVSQEERSTIASHMLDCPRCANEVAEIRRQQAIFDPFPAAEASLFTIIRRLVATLVVPQMLPVMREPLPSTGWPRQYQAESLALSLHISRGTSGEAMLLGILTSTSLSEQVDAFEGVPVELYATPELPGAGSPGAEKTALPLLTTQIDDVGNILLEPIPSGEYVLIIRLPDRELIVEGLNIQLP